MPEVASLAMTGKGDSAEGVNVGLGVWDAVPDAEWVAVREEVCVPEPV